MIKLTKLLSQIIQESKRLNLEGHNAILFEESQIFLELSNPNAAYKYKELNPDVWEFQDRFKNNLGVLINPSTKYVDSFYKMKNLEGQEIRVFDYEKHKDTLDLTTYQGGSDEHRSDTICKIILDEILPKYLLNKKPSIIKFHPIDDYRHKIFYKCAEVCKEKHPELEIKKLNNEIHLINK